MNTTTLAQQNDEWRDRNPLRKRRKAAGLSLMMTAGSVGVGMSTLQVWEAGTREPDDQQMAALADLFDEDPAKLANEWRRWLGRRPTGAAA